MRSQREDGQPATLPLGHLMSIGWGVLGIEPGQEIVLGTITKPWQADVQFHSLDPQAFASFAEPGYAKIVVAIRVDEVSSEHC